MNDALGNGVLGLLEILEHLVSPVEDEEAPLPGLDSPALLHQVARLVVGLVGLERERKGEEVSRSKGQEKSSKKEREKIEECKANHKKRFFFRKISWRHAKENRARKVGVTR